MMFFNTNIIWRIFFLKVPDLIGQKEPSLASVPVGVSEVIRFLMAILLKI
ncbi:hypothetical protein [Sphingobacterium multivorum]